MTQFSAKCRNAIRKAEKMGVVCEVDTDCETIENFRTLYYKTMTKDHADEYYFFSMEYFNRMKEDLGGQILLINALLDGRIIASSLFMLSDSFMHYHLSATDPEFYTFSANNLILKAAAELGNRTGRQWLHLGGGLSSSESDSLFKFKRSFAREERNLKEFWLGKAVYMQDIYNRLVDLRRAEGQFDEGTGFFPAYRAKK